MSTIMTVQYTKPGATYASGTEAHDDKISLYGAELNASISDCYAKMLTDGVLLEPVSYTWDQATEILTVTKVVSTAEAYKAAETFDVDALLVASLSGGWTLVGYSDGN